MIKIAERVETVPEIDRIKAALDTLLTAAIEHDLKPRAEDPGPIVFSSDWAAKPIPTRRECDMARLLGDPIGGALRNAIRLLGERLFEVAGDIDAMREIAEEIAGRDERHFGRRLDIMDKRWSAIGAASVGWWIA